MRATALLLPFLFLACTSSAAAEGRTPVWEPTTISQPGSYVLTRNIDTGGGIRAIEITVGNVELVLNGFTITQGGPTTAISACCGPLTIRNGLTDFDTSGRQGFVRRLCYTRNSKLGKGR